MLFVCTLGSNRRNVHILFARRNHLSDDSTFKDKCEFTNFNLKLKLALGCKKRWANSLSSSTNWKTLMLTLNSFIHKTFLSFDKYWILPVYLDDAYNFFIYKSNRGSDFPPTSMNSNLLNGKGHSFCLTSDECIIYIII